MPTKAAAFDRARRVQQLRVTTRCLHVEARLDWASASRNTPKNLLVRGPDGCFGAEGETRTHEPREASPVFNSCPSLSSLFPPPDTQGLW